MKSGMLCIVIHWLMGAVCAGILGCHGNLDSDEVQRLLNTRGMNLHIFVKRSDADGKQFFYLGKAKIQADSVRGRIARC